MNTKPVAKSLHTVTVIVQIARLELNMGFNDLPEEPVARNNEAVTRALEHLGLDQRPDPYGLAAAAFRQLNAGA